MAKIESTKDLLMHLLYAPGMNGEVCEPIKGKTRLQKLLFLFEKEIWKKFKLDKHISANALPEFEPYDYGPFSKQIYEDLEFLTSVGLVSGSGQQVEQDEAFLEEINDANEEEVYKLTELGKTFVEEGEAGQLSSNQTSVLSDFKAKCSKMPLRALLLYVYSKYPEMTTNSKIRDEVLGGKLPTMDVL